jgi:hypothetical protein
MVITESFIYLKLDQDRHTLQTQHINNIIRNYKNSQAPKTIPVPGIRCILTSYMFYFDRFWETFI